MTNEVDLHTEYWPRIIYESDIKEYLSTYVRGQEKALDLLGFIGFLYTSSMFAQHCQIRKTSLPRVNLLMTGPTGGGKTFIAKHFAESLNLHYKKIDCSSVSAEGWHGTNLSELLADYLKECPSGFGVLHLDEIDKIGITGRENQEGKVQLQMGLLDLLDGDYNHSSSDKHGRSSGPLTAINNSLVVMTGSFQQDRNDKKDAKNKIGFKDIHPDKDERTYKEKMLELGFLQEFAARIVTQVELEPYTQEQVKDIIVNAKSSPYAKFQQLFGLRASLEDHEIDELVESVQNTKNGLRELDSLMFHKFFEKGI